MLINIYHRLLRPRRHAVEQQKYIEYDVNRGRGDGKRA
jgi:hypothetical protein|tara:strand:- start:304 stop:417 length:114 start_codon:yes stop_codon:yes gene_type:complete